MAGLTLNHSKDVINHIDGESSWDYSQFGMKLGLLTADPTDAGNTKEVSSTGTGYARVDTMSIFNAAVNGVTKNNADLVFPTATAEWGVITHIGFFGSIDTAQTYLYMYQELANPRYINTGDVFKILANNLTLTVA